MGTVHHVFPLFRRQPFLSLFTSGTMKSFQNGSTLRFYSVCELFAYIYELSSPGNKFRDNFPYFSIKTYIVTPH